MGNIRRSRGYSFEHKLVQRLNNGEWNARRLGGSSTGLPDIVAVNNKTGTLLTIEAKSGTGDILYVPADQIERCILIDRMFSYYDKRHIILAFKFMKKRRLQRKSNIIYEARQLVEHYLLADALSKKTEYPIIKCMYSGATYAIYPDKSKKLTLPRFQMPFM
ncbi:resolvase [Nitrososphaera sp. AFS]|uniref:resolvase n=1 Tax=Nitrososphaera sp. AFS TaxID=2301191 RepID=UPI0013924238|nr:resolvase [Nitrososphaera sp. AFS]NAL78752.1 resolvase [Nitrososphaera sp. AFS]